MKEMCNRSFFYSIIVCHLWYVWMYDLDHPYKKAVLLSGARYIEFGKMMGVMNLEYTTNVTYVIILLDYSSVENPI